MRAPVGRFAPTPSGPLHFGSLLTAVASFLDSKSHGGRWLLRIDDLDRTRSDRKHATDIIEILARHGLESDEPPIWQSEREELYARAIRTLRSAHRVYQCICSRKTLWGFSTYPGTCRQARHAPSANQSTRFIVPPGEVCVEDEIQGRYCEDLSTSCGDFVVVRRDGFIAYHLATVLDDADMHVTHVVRGADLLTSTPRQVALAEALGLRAPSFAHIPVVLDTSGHKASKSLASTPINALSEHDVKQHLSTCMQLLGLLPPKLSEHSPESLLAWASARFTLRRLPAQLTRSDFVCL
ncbi:MAG: tRNA glutamyl-Q(34) synthetase GluQRS [Gammaproteobacteria bacterium]|nr:tRNA glutamyl-Q(34) synthetase GluQRS [Gammaproteobacteria bacterium]MCY4276458.1 tRNA glutamyl-Q(34) synthetase GluQRS [Gammaproteobacteria bacterium]MCY4322433.1 tRNA glutamyl-Q(34) synthetase GluQRS [Gammaproteobacteria bacterium]